MVRWPELRSLIDIGLLAVVMMRVCLGGCAGSRVGLALLGAVDVSAVVLSLVVALARVASDGLVADAGLAGAGCGLAIC